MMVLVVLLLLLVVVADGVYFVLSCFRACNHFECTKLKSIRIHCPIPILNRYSDTYGTLEQDKIRDVL